MNMKFVTVLSLVFTVGMSWSHSVPPELFESGSAVLFQGDSITDGMHGGDMNHVYGHGYACEIASRYQAYRPEGRVQFGNRGKSGDTSSNLVERWSTDAFPYVIRENGYEGALGLKKGQFVTPDWVSILVGINDYFYWIRNLPQKVSCEDYEKNLRKLVADAKTANPKVKIVLCEPFRIPTDASPEFCRRQDVVAKLAAEFDCAFVPFQKLFSEDLLKLNANPRYWFWDFFHPTPAGHMKMADFWIDSVDRRVRRTVRNTALEPRAKLEDDSYDWYARHERIVKEQAKIDPEIVFIGDSITHGWEANDNLRGDAADCFKKWFGKYRTLNMGFGWDRIQNVLWRLSHGEMDGTKPRVVVIHIGTNNTAPGCKRPFPANTSDEIAEGIVEVCRRVREKAPRAKIVLMDVFPRGGKDQRWRKDVAAVNAALGPKVEALADGNLVRVNLWDKYVGPDGEIPKELMFDTLHPTVKGYDIWGEALRPFVDSAVEITAYRALSEVKDGTRVWDAALRRAMSEHTVVVFPKGDYQFAETILVGSNCRLEADADATIGHAPAFDGLLVRNVPGAKNVRISGGTWYDHPRDKLKYGDYRNTVGDNSQMFRFLWCEGVVFRDLVGGRVPGTNDTVKRYSRGGCVMVDPSVRRLHVRLPVG